MREYKFRAHIRQLDIIRPIERINFDIGTIEVHLADDGDYHNDLFEYGFDEIELMQWTRLKDKNGVEIYEDDIVKCIEVSESNSREDVSEVFFEDGCWLVHESEMCDVELYLYDNSNPTKMPLTEIEVIGNVFENYELLEVK